jgi:predicted ArsR family transcriptional regulator
MSVVNIPPGSTLEHSTRERVLALVSSEGPITAAAVAERLGLTPTGVRRHLDALADHGAITEHEPTHVSVARGRGRPARSYVVSDAGHAALPAGYADLAAEVLTFLQRPDAGGLEAFAASRATTIMERYRGAVDAAGAEPTARVGALVEALSADGYAATARPVGVGSLSGVQVCQGHCPVHHVAAQFPQLCEAETEAFSHLLGVHVQRLATLAAGHHVCTTFIPTPTHPGSPSAPRERTPS